MNHTRLVGILKTLVTEAHHNARYNYGKKNLAKASLHVPDKSPQLAEGNKKKHKNKLGKTDTGLPANHIDTEPGYNSQIEPTRGAAKPQNLDTK